MFTEQDVRDAIHAATVDADMQAQECDLRAALLAHTFTEPSSPEEAAEYAAGLAQYHRGKDVLLVARLVRSHRAIAGTADDFPDRIEGEWQGVAVRLPAGHIANSEAVRWVALQAREGAE